MSHQCHPNDESVPMDVDPLVFTQIEKLLSVVEPQKQNLAASRMKGNASTVEIRATWHVIAQRRNISTQSHTKPSKSLFLTNLSTLIVRSPIIIEDSENQISNRLNSAIFPKDTSLLLKK